MPLYFCRATTPYFAIPKPRHIPEQCLSAVLQNLGHLGESFCASFCVPSLPKYRFVTVVNLLIRSRLGDQSLVATLAAHCGTLGWRISRSPSAILNGEIVAIRMSSASFGLSMSHKAIDWHAGVQAAKWPNSSRRCYNGPKLRLKGLSAALATSQWMSSAKSSMSETHDSFWTNSPSAAPCQTTKKTFWLEKSAAWDTRLRNIRFVKF
ncbi:hypothetical protein GQ53DRAFT_527238 [Thozetella sp. PMI_491]|nr:hypothetical protein GQ53DRAFT_527238 [Thozetella sp. PMI_491]